MKTMTIDEVQNFIMTNASKEDIRAIQYAIKYRVDSMRTQVKRNISLGDKVAFKSQKDFGSYTAVVTKIARKRAHVQILECSNLRCPMYRVGSTVIVPMEMLSF